MCYDYATGFHCVIYYVLYESLLIFEPCEDPAYNTRGMQSRLFEFQKELTRIAHK